MEATNKAPSPSNWSPPFIPAHRTQSAEASPPSIPSGNTAFRRVSSGNSSSSTSPSTSPPILATNNTLKIKLPYFELSKSSAPEPELEAELELEPEPLTPPFLGRTSPSNMVSGYVEKGVQVKDSPEGKSPLHEFKDSLFLMKMKQAKVSFYEVPFYEKVNFLAKALKQELGKIPNNLKSDFLGIISIIMFSPQIEKTYKEKYKPPLFGLIAFLKTKIIDKNFKTLDENLFLDGIFYYAQHTNKREVDKETHIAKKTTKSIERIALDYFQEDKLNNSQLSLDDFIKQIRSKYN